MAGEEHEIWKPIKKYEGWYEISNLGRVRSLDRFVNHSNKGFKSFRKGKIISPGKTKDGYLFVNISKNQKSQNLRINRLVAQTFIPNPNNYPQVNHKDEDKTNNKASNLEWCTAKYNDNYGARNKKVAKKRGKKVIQLTLDGQVVHVWPSAHECARAGFSYGNVCACCRGERNMHKGYRWKYV